MWCLAKMSFWPHRNVNYQFRPFRFEREFMKLVIWADHDGAITSKRSIIWQSRIAMGFVKWSYPWIVNDVWTWTRPSWCSRPRNWQVNRSRTISVETLTVLLNSLDLWMVKRDTDDERQTVWDRSRNIFIFRPVSILTADRCSTLSGINHGSRQTSNGRCDQRGYHLY